MMFSPMYLNYCLRLHFEKIYIPCTTQAMTKTQEHTTSTIWLSETFRKIKAIIAIIQFIMATFRIVDLFILSLAIPFFNTRY